MDCPQSLNVLITNLNHSANSNHGKILKEMNVSTEDFEYYASWEKGGYTRNCICRTDEYELILLCWDKNVETAIHDHDGQNCWVYQVDGQVSEVRYEQNEMDDLIEVNRVQLSPGKLTYMNKSMGFHKLVNDIDGRAMTLHVYVSPISSCQVFCDEKEGFELKELEYDTIHENAIAEIA